MGLLGKVFKKVAESAGDSKKSDKTATSAELSQMDKEIEKELEQLRKDSDALHKKMSKLPKL
jgi:hypothetical protein